MKRAKFEVVGSITVDAGLIMVGDPCYSHEDSEWLDFLNDNKLSENDTAVIPHERTEGNYGDCGKAITVASGFGDGVYDVEVKRCLTTGHIKELRIKFF